MHYVGKLDTALYSCITKDISTDEIIITDNQILHILERHPEAYCDFLSHIQEALKSPDYILADKHVNTGLIIKKFFGLKSIYKLYSDCAHPQIMLIIKTPSFLIGKSVIND